jgi:serine/threonine-protein kinase RsbW
MHPVDIHLDLPADVFFLQIISCAVQTLVHFAGEVDEKESNCYAIQLAVQEAGVNVAKYAYASEGTGSGTHLGRIHVDLMYDPDLHLICVELSDQGASFDISQISEPDLSDAHEGGYGIFLMHSLMDSVEYISNGSSNRWRLTKKI